MLLSSVVIRLVINKHYLSKHCLSKQSSRTVSALKQLSKAIRNPHQYSRRISLRGMHLLPLPTTRLHTSKPFMMGHYTIPAWVFLAILPSYLAITQTAGGCEASLLFSLT